MNHWVILLANTSYIEISCVSLYHTPIVSFSKLQITTGKEGVRILKLNLPMDNSYLFGLQRIYLSFHISQICWIHFSRLN